jgi:hypothetical protein
MPAEVEKNPVAAVREVATGWEQIVRQLRGF